MGQSNTGRLVVMMSTLLIRASAGSAALPGLDQTPTVAGRLSLDIVGATGTSPLNPLLRVLAVNVVESHFTCDFGHSAYVLFMVGSGRVTSEALLFDMRGVTSYLYHFGECNNSECLALIRAQPNDDQWVARINIWGANVHRLAHWCGYFG